MRYEGKILQKSWGGRKKIRLRERKREYVLCVEVAGYILKNYFIIGKYFFL